MPVGEQQVKFWKGLVDSLYEVDNVPEDILLDTISGKLSGLVCAVVILT